MDEYGPEDFDLFEYTGGLIGQMDADGRIRTTISQIKETGRHGSSNPNLQNISKRQEPRYQQIMGYKIEKIRSCFQARPGYVLIEADYKSAEIVTLAYISGDPNLIADALGPVKLHAKVAVDILGANCAYQEVAEKFPHLYVGAKNINFGCKQLTSKIDMLYSVAVRGYSSGTQEAVNLSVVWYGVRLCRSDEGEVLYPVPQDSAA